MKTGNLGLWVLVVVAMIVGLLGLLSVFPLMLLFPDWEHPNAQQFESYHNLENWNLSGHGIDDFDGDGIADMVTITGCAYLSSLQIDSVPEDQKCKATNMFSLAGLEKDVVGVRYIQNDSRLDLSDPDNLPRIDHSYMGKKPGGLWRIYVNESGKMRVLEIVPGVGLVEVEDNSAELRKDELRYSVSKLSYFSSIPFVLVQQHVHGWMCSNFWCE